MKRKNHYVDNNNTFTDKKPLTYEQCGKVFDIEDKQIFAANVDFKLIEMHMQEERKDIVGSVQKIREMFDFLRPVLEEVANQKCRGFSSVLMCMRIPLV